MSRVWREFNSINTRRALLCECLFILGLISITYLNEGEAQWRRVCYSGPAFQIPGDRFNIVASIRSIVFTNNGIGFAGVSPGPLNPRGTILISNDSGITWSQAKIRFGPSFTNEICPDDFAFKDSNTGWFVSMNGADPRNGGGSIFKTSDAGSSWFCVFSSPSYEPRAIYQSHINGYVFASLWYPASLIISTDEGNTWSNSVTDQDGFNGISALDSIIIVTTGGHAHQLRSTDGGLSWQKSFPRTLPNPSVECWQPYCDTISKIFYIEDDASDGGTTTARFYRSVDEGETWEEISGFNFYYYINADGGLSPYNAINGCIRGDQFGNLYIQKVQEGMFRSSDSGTTWVSICGPGNRLDTRFCVFNNTLFAGDSVGIWALQLNQPQRILLDPSVTISASKCKTGNKFFYFRSTFPCPSAVTLDSINVVGSSTFTAHSEEYQENGIAIDSILVQYQSDHDFDTASLVFHFRVNGIQHDTLVTIYGAALPPASFDLYLKPSTTVVHSGDTINIPVYLSTSGNITIDSATAITIPFFLDTEMVHVLSFTLAINNFSAGPLSYSNDTLLVPCEARNGFSINGEKLIGTLRCVVYLTDTLTSTISIANASINSADPRCISLSTENSSSTISLQGCGDSILAQFLATGKVPLTIESVTPNPARDEVVVGYWVSGLGSRVGIEMYDQLGRVVLSQEFAAPEGDAGKAALQVGSLPSGIYYLRVASGGFSASRRVVVER